MVGLVEIRSKIEVIVDRDMDGGEFLQSLDVPERRHRPVEIAERIFHPSRLQNSLRLLKLV
jgi:hypothetical protein